MILVSVESVITDKLGFFLEQPTMTIADTISEMTAAFILPNYVYADSCRHIKTGKGLRRIWL